jgi:hypothetical protein
MAYIYSKVDDLEGTEKVGSKQCVALLLYYAKLPATGAWKQGTPVLGNLSLPKGTAIATFVNGRYPDHSTGNHAAFYLSQDVGGIWMMDQWFNDATKPKVCKRYVRKRGKLPNGDYLDPSNNAEAYSVIE